MSDLVIDKFVPSETYYFNYILEFLDIERYLVLECDYMIFHIEKRFYQDRGPYIWFAENNVEFHNDVGQSNAAQRQHVDNQDLFPRIFFKKENLISEMAEFIHCRDAKILNVKKGDI